MAGEAQSFLTELQSEVLDRAGGGDGSRPDFQENVFTEIVMELLATEVGVVESPEACYFTKEIGRGHAKINGFAIGEDGDNEAIDLFVSVYNGYSEVTRVSPDDLRRAGEQAVRFLTAALDNLHTKLDPAHAQFQMARRIHDAGPGLRRGRLFILTDGQTSLSRQKPTTVPIKDSKLQLRVEFWDIERLARVAGSGNPQSDIEIDVVELNGAPLPCITAPVDDQEYRAFVAILPGEFLFKMYDEHGAALLQRNVRSFLQAKGKVNRGMRESIKQQPGRFLAYNNGISLTAEGVETTITDAGLAITRIKGLQIVNGGQTTASIHRAGKIDKFDLSRVFVQAKLTVLNPELIDVLAPRIAEYANTQNPVQMADFSANDPFHVEFERLSTNVWTPDGQARWFYERTRGQYFVELSRLGKGTAREKRFKEITPKHRKFGKLDVAKVISAWDQLPFQVSLGGQKNFVLFTQRMRETKPKTWKPDERFYKETIAKLIIFTAANRLVANTKFKEFKSQFAAYIVASLSFLTGGAFDLLLVWQHQRISLQLEDLISRWVEVIGAQLLAQATDQGRSASEWCKRQECWKGVQRMSLPWPDDVPPEFQKVERIGGGWGSAPTEQRVALDPDELDARQRIRQLDSSDWIRVIDWGTRSGILDIRQREAAAEIAANAAAGWQNELSTRKALLGREILNLAMDNGVLGASALQE